MSHFRSYSESALINNNNNNNNNSNGFTNGCQIANNGNGFTNGIQDTNNNNNHDDDSSNMDHSNDANSPPVQHLIDTLPNGFIKINLNSQQSLERLFNPSEIEASVPLRQRNLPPSFFDPSARKSNGFHSRSTSFDLRQTSQAAAPARGHGIHQRTQSVLAPMTGLMSPLNSSAGSSTSNSTTKIMSDHHHQHNPHQQQQPPSQQQAFFDASARKSNVGAHSRSTSFDLRQTASQVAPPTAPRVHQRTQSVLAPMTGPLNWTSEEPAANQNGNGPPIEQQQQQQQQQQNYYMNANGTSQAHYGSSNSVYSSNHHQHQQHQQQHQQQQQHQHQQQHDQLAAGNCGNSGASGPPNGTLNGGCQAGDYYAGDHQPASTSSAQYEHRPACLSSSSSSSLNAPNPMQLAGSSAPAQYEQQHHHRISSTSSLNTPAPVQLVSSAPTGYHYPASSSSAVHFGQPAACHSAVPLAAAAAGSQYYHQPNGQQQLMEPQYQPQQPQQASNYSDYQEPQQHQFIYQSQASECQLQHQHQPLHHNHSHQHHNHNHNNHQHNHHHHQQLPPLQQQQQLPLPLSHQHHHHQLPGQSHHNPIQFNYRAQHKLK